jgi:hypothetical protein
MNLASLKILMVIFSLLIININISAQEPATAQFDEYYEFVDTTNKILSASSEELKIELRYPPENILDKYKNDGAFDYQKKLEEKQDWLAKITSWINQQLRSLRYSRTYSTALDIFYYALIIFALIIVLWGLIKSDIRSLFSGKSINNEIKLSEHEEDINQINFDNLISIAIDNKNYKLAVRYLFLKSLKMLDNKEIINIKKDKTNYQYLLEIKDSELADAFKDAAYRFEWIWYGDFPIDEKLMNVSKNHFTKLFKLINA